MADQNYHFPASGSTYTLPDGRTLYIKIYYDTGGGATNTDTGALIKRISNLKIPLEVASSAQKFRHASMDIEFWNTGGVFEDEDILNTTYPYDTFIDIQINGSLFWRGVIDFTKTKKSKFRYDSAGDLIYDAVKVKCVDALFYFWTHDTDLSDVSYTDDSTLLDTLFENIAAEIGFASGDVSLDANMVISEEIGTTYTWEDLKMNGYVDTTLVRTFLKEAMLGFCVFIFNFNGKFYVILRKLGTTQAIAQADILSIKIKENFNPIDYVKFELVRDWSDIGPIPGGREVTYSQEYGTTPEDDNKKFEHIEADGDLLSTVFATKTLTADPNSVTLSAATGKIYLETSTDLIAATVESGDRLSYNEVADIQYSIVKDIADLGGGTNSLDCEAIATDDIVVAAETFSVLQGPGNRRYKIWMLFELLKDTYDQYFRTSNDVLWLKLKDIATHSDPSKRFVWNSLNHKISSITCDIVKNEVQFDLHQVT